MKHGSCSATEVMLLPILCNTIARSLPVNRNSMIADQLRLIDSKVRAGYYLMRVREFRRRLAASPFPGPSIRDVTQFPSRSTGEGPGTHIPIPNPQ